MLKVQIKKTILMIFLMENGVGVFKGTSTYLGILWFSVWKLHKYVWRNFYVSFHHTPTLNLEDHKCETNKETYLTYMQCTHINLLSLKRQRIERLCVGGCLIFMFIFSKLLWNMMIYKCLKVSLMYRMEEDVALSLLLSS